MVVSPGQNQNCLKRNWSEQNVVLSVWRMTRIEKESETVLQEPDIGSHISRILQWRGSFFYVIKVNKLGHLQQLE